MITYVRSKAHLYMSVGPVVQKQVSSEVYKHFFKDLVAINNSFGH